jgi:hypothetical protein
LQIIAGAAEKRRCPSCKARFAARTNPARTHAKQEKVRTERFRRWLPMMAIPTALLVLAAIILIIRLTRSGRSSELVAVAEKSPSAPPLIAASTDRQPVVQEPTPIVLPRVQEPTPIVLPRVEVSPPPIAPPAENAKVPAIEFRPLDDAPPAPAKSVPQDAEQAPPPRQPAPVPPVPSEAQVRVNRAIDRGVVYLKARLPKMFTREGKCGYRTGVSALAGLALLESGVPAEDPVVQKIVDRVRLEAFDLTNTYEISTTIWFLDRLGDARDRFCIRSLALQLIAAQSENGGWGYTCRPLKDAEAKRLTRLLKAPPADSAADLPPAVRFRPQAAPRVADIGREDNSCTQFALLAVWAARKYEVPVDRSLSMIEPRFRRSQNADGSWGYYPSRFERGQITGFQRREASMTCAGLLGLAVGHALRERPMRAAEQVKDAARSKALFFLGQTVGNGVPIAATKRLQMQQRATKAKRLQEEFLTLMRRYHLLSETIYPLLFEVERMNEILNSLNGNARAQAAKKQEFMLELAKKTLPLQPTLDEVSKLTVDLQRIRPSGNEFKGELIKAKSWGDVYFLWSLERMAVVYNLPTIAGKDWYAWGSAILVAAQNEDGSWSDAFPGVVDTCFALLFLKRANIAKDLSKALQLQGRFPDVSPSEMAEFSKHYEKHSSPSTSP